ncbi:MAG TPA: hypothetical protein PKN85_05460 [Syntrophorhabdaceae bacterium]|nr:hypothetical protein [Syntrophorhabdaceae bacterium]
MRTLQHPVLQYRWQVKETNGGPQLVYFGLRNPPNHTRSIIPVPRELADCLRSLDGRTSAKDLPSDLAGREMYTRFVEEGIIVDAREVRQPSTRDSFRQCVRCVTNDYVLPGLEFDEDGLCAFCQCYELAERSGQGAIMQDGITDEDLVRISSGNTGSRFDAMVLYTGGKDSTYLLWYLAKKLELRVLVASWNMPYTNDTCRENMRRAMRILPHVEFVERTLPWKMVRQAMRDQFERVGWPCLCPTVAHALFYPLAVQEGIPLVMHGVEEVQLAVMNYVMTEIRSGQPREERVPNHRADTLNFLRMVTTISEPAQPYSLTADLARHMSSVSELLAPVYKPLGDILARAESDPNMPLPILRRLTSNAAYGSWAKAVERMKQEMDWQMPPGQKGLLHTSCRIEKVKDYCQFKRFQGAGSTFLPQAIVELGAGVYFGLLSRDDALEELQESGYYNEPRVLSELTRDLGIDRGEARAAGEMSWTLGECTGCST